MIPFWARLRWPHLTLRDFRKFRARDFERHAVWVDVMSADDDTPLAEAVDEEAFRPWKGELPIAANGCMVLCRATLTLADGTTLPGFATPLDAEDATKTPEDLGMSQPHAFLPNGRWFSFWQGGFFEPQESRQNLDAFYATLNRTPAQVFPITYRIDPSLAQGVTSGTIPGFCGGSDDGVVVTT